MSMVKYEEIAGTEPNEDNEGGDTRFDDGKLSETHSTSTEEIKRVKTAYDEDTTSESFVSVHSSDQGGYWHRKPFGPHRAYSATSGSSGSSFGRPPYGPYKPDFYKYVPVESDEWRERERSPSRSPSPPRRRPPTRQETGPSTSGGRLDNDNETVVSKDTERIKEYANFPSRDADRRLRSIRRQAKTPLAVKPWCVRDVAWLDTKLGEQNQDEEPARGQINYTPFPHLPSAAGQLAIALGIVEERPADPQWEGPTTLELQKLDVWFLAGAQHCLRSQSSGSPDFFLGFPRIEQFEERLKTALEGLTYHRYAKKGSNLLKRVFDICHFNRLGIIPPLETVAEIQDRLQPAQRHYLRICLMICFNLKRLRFWRWREYNREYQRLLVGFIVLSKVVHEVLDESGRLYADDVVESLEMLRQLANPIIPIYQRRRIVRQELLMAARKRFARYPEMFREGIAFDARIAFLFKGSVFSEWTDEQLQAYAAPDDDLWRTIDLKRIQPRSAEYEWRSEIPAYHWSMDISLRVKQKWMIRMRSMTTMQKEYLSNIGDHFVFPSHPNTLEKIWKQVTNGENNYIYKIPKPLRRSSSLPNMTHRKALSRRLYDDQDTSNLGFDINFLPARQPPRLHDGHPPAYPHESIADPHLCHLRDGVVSHSFIVIGWFPGEQSEPVEVCMWYTDPEKFLSKLRTQINTLRGWRRYLSLKTVQSFGMYKCILSDRSHQIIDCKAHEDAILAQFHAACFKKALNRDRDESSEWAQWATTELNNWQGGNTFYFPMPIESHLSLRLITRWSRYRLILASAIPMMLSLVVGFYYMAVSGDVQTAWTVSGYIVTAGAFLIAVLAVLTNVQDGGIDVGEAKKRGPDPGQGV